MAAAAVDSPHPESPFGEDEIYACKGCSEILEEGKAFELAGNRWHIDCFRCNTCGTLLDSDANLLLLGDGSLICNNCTYSCNACGNKIEDLAILTGDQAFCSSCFRCRNCKRKIENLRYARTSQGIFCMSCHESLMARRRKKSRAASKAGQNGTQTVKEKALPSLPPGAVLQSAFSPELDTPSPDTATPNPRSPPEGQRRGELAQAGDVSPASNELRRDGPTLPASTYAAARPSNVEQDSDDGEERGFLPMAFDPTPVAGPPPITRKPVTKTSDTPTTAQSDSRLPPDYFSRLSSKSGNRDMRDRDEDQRSRSVSTERDGDRRAGPPKSSPHILYQEKGRSRKRDTSENITPASGSSLTSPVMSSSQDKADRPRVQHVDSSSPQQNDGFKLQEVPKSKRAGSRSGSKTEGTPTLLSTGGLPPMEGGLRDGRYASNSPGSLDSRASGVNPFEDPNLPDTNGPGPAPASRHAERPARGDSLAASAQNGRIPFEQTAQGRAASDGEETVSSATIMDAQSGLSMGNSRSNNVDSPQGMRSSFDAPPPRSSSRPMTSVKAGPLEEFNAPRAAPPPPAGLIERHRNNESVSTMQSQEARSDGQLSPPMRSAGLPKHSLDGTFSMEEEMARIMRGEPRRERPYADTASPSVLRKVSNAVKHGRSFSDRGLHSAGKASNGGFEISTPLTISSPILSSPTGKESYDEVMAQLRRARQRITELETEKNGLEDQVNSSTEIKAATNELHEKRNTIVMLDTQREMVVRELEAMTEHLSKAKDSSKPLDLTTLKSDVLRDFATSLQRLKSQMTAEIEELMLKRNQLTEEIGTLIQMKDKGFQEYEALSNKNAQLLEMNSQILQNIQDVYKSNRTANGSIGANGLGIYHGGSRGDVSGASDIRNLNIVNMDASIPSVLQETDGEPATILTAPQVVNIRKGQPKKFNWRRGGEKVAKNVTKGIRGAFGGREGEAPYANIGMPYNPSQQAMGSDTSSLQGRSGLDTNRGPASFGFFAQKNAGLKTGPLGTMKDNSSTSLAAADASVLFGSELEARCEYERRVIPSIVSRCIDEVEARGMDVEGVYRKSGGSGQVKTVQQGFERDGNYDISDPDLDIHAVTSALKQYFRKLPTPLITYDVYENLLEAGRVAERERQVQALRLALEHLPEHHHDCLEYLIQHLARVMSRESINLMTPLNLAVVFAPTIMRPLSVEREMSDMQAQRIAVQALLDNHTAVFPDE